VVLVNPHAFEKEDADANISSGGDRKRIVGKVTVETARLVAEVVSFVVQSLIICSYWILINILYQLLIY
jgi:hypothetical protein